jgi:hypothetical protein
MRSRLPVILLAILATALYAIAGHLIFGGRPLHVDEITQAIQARIFASGRLWLPTPDPPEFFSALLMVNREGRTFAQFPPGWPLHLALGYLLHAPWLIAPLCGGLAILGLDQLLRATGESGPTRAAALLLFSLSPWVVFNSASWMNHLPTVMWLLIGLALVATAMRPEPGGGWVLPLGGVAFGLAFAIRPVDALAFFVPTACWVGHARLERRISWIELGGFVAGFAVPVIGVLVFNRATTGAPLLLGYEAQWGPAHRLGFHAAPWGPPHTVARGWGLISGYIRQLQWTMYESPVSALLAPALAIVLTRRWRAVDLVLLAGAGLLSLAYFAYWFEADYLGPRYLFPLAPLIAIWTARLPGALRDRGAWSWVGQAAALAIAVNVVAGMVFGVPDRWRAYASYAPARRWDADSALTAAGIRDGIILVREPWVAQVNSRLVGLGVPRATIERLSRNTDLCILDLTTALLERDRRRWPELAPALDRIMRDSLALTQSSATSDPSARMLPGFRYPDRCRARAQEDRLGTLPLLPLQLTDRAGNLFARDLHERTPLLLANQLGRPVYVLAVRRDVHGDAVRSFEPFFADSAERDWRAATPR